MAAGWSGEPKQLRHMPAALAGRLGFSGLITPLSPVVRGRHLQVFSPAGKSNFFHDTSGSKSKCSKRHEMEVSGLLRPTSGNWQCPFSYVLLVGAVINSTPSEG